jgi:hypothetical protein
MEHADHADRVGTLRHRLRASALAAALLAGVAAVPGCTLLGGMIESYRQQSTFAVPAEYVGLAGKSVAVVVIADRSIEADFPGITGTLIDRINNNLRDNAGPSKAFPSVQLVQYLMNNPQLLVRPRGELAKDLGVERLVVVELQEFRLNDPGNQYLWDGVAIGQVAVVEADGPLPDDYAFARPVRVAFPDKKGMGPEQFGRDVVSSALISRFINRTSWFFYEHQEPYYPEPGLGLNR